MRSSCARATPTSSATFQAGVPWAVATCGTALAEEHFTLLRNFAKRIVLAYDADAAGQSATSRVYEWERKHEVDVVVADLPGGSDPGELARTDPADLARAIKEARPFLQFRVDRMLQAGDLADGRGPSPGGRGGADGGRRAPRRPGPRPVRHAARRPSAMSTRPSSGSVWSTCGPTLRPRSRPGAAGDRRTSRRSVTIPRTTAISWRPVGRGIGSAVGTALRPGPGLEALKLAVHRPEDVVDRVHAVLFTDRVQRQAFVAFLENDSVHEAVETASPEVASLLRRVIVEEPMAGDPDLGDPVDSVVVLMLRDAANARSQRSRSSRG